MKRLLPLFISALLMVHCGDGRSSSSSTPIRAFGSPSPTTVTVAPSDVQVPLGGTAQFTGTVAGTSSTAVTWTLSGTACNAGVCGRIDQNGLFSAPPAPAPTPLNVTITASLSGDPTIFGNANATVVSPSSSFAPVITTQALPNGQAGIAYSATVEASGVAPFTWAVTGGTLPPGLSLAVAPGSVNAVISGTPTQAGSFAITVTVTDSEAPPRTSSKDFVLVITP